MNGAGVKIKGFWKLKELTTLFCHRSSTYCILFCVLGKEDLMANSEMILRLLTDLKIEQQLLKEQLEKCKQL